MNQDKIDSIVKSAEAAVAAVSDETLKAETYKIVLTELLRNGVGSNVPATPSGSGAQVPVAPGRVAGKGDGPAAKVAAWIGTNEDVVGEVFEFGDTAATVRLAHSLLPKKIADAQRLLAHLKLSVEKIGYDADEVTAKGMIEMFDDHGCKDGNAAKNLKASGYIIPKGGKGTMKSYKLRYSGLTATLEEVKNVLGIAS